MTIVFHCRALLSCLVRSSGSAPQSLAPRPAASASSGYLLEIQILRLRPRPTESEPEICTPSSRPGGVDACSMGEPLQGIFFSSQDMKSAGHWLSPGDIRATPSCRESSEEQLYTLGPCRERWVGERGPQWLLSQPSISFCPRAVVLCIAGSPWCADGPAGPPTALPQLRATLPLWS